MKTAKKCLLIFLIFSLTALPGCHETVTSGAAEDKTYTYLILGLDDAAQNADVMFFASFCPSARKIRIVQIPRDTYFAFGGAQNKLNQYYATRRAAGEDGATAVATTRQALSETFGVPTDGVVAFTVRAFRDMVDILGGVDMTFPEDFAYGDGEEAMYFSAGTHRFDGAAAEKIVRYRKGYATGDLGRMDMQKMFLSALFRTAADHLGADEVFRMATTLGGEVLTDIGLFNAAGLVIRHADDARASEVTYVTLPGEATRTDTGLSYYVVNRKGALDVLSPLGATDGTFDPQRRLTNAGTAFDNIYTDSHMAYKTYSDGTVGEVKIPHSR